MHPRQAILLRQASEVADSLLGKPAQKAASPAQWKAPSQEAVDFVREPSTKDVWKAE